MEEKSNSKRWISLIGNKFFLTAFLFTVWMLFLDNYCYFDAQKDLNKQLDALKNQKKYYKTEIANDKKSIQELKNPDLIEKYAREKYFMKKDSEDVYVIEFESDTIKK